jgi:hypothetical protein
LLDEATKLREVVGPLPPELGRTGDLTPLRHRLQLAWFESEDRHRLLGRATLAAFGGRAFEDCRDALGLAGEQCFDDGAARVAHAIRLALGLGDQRRESAR